MRKFKQIAGGRWESEDKVVVNLHFDHDMMSHEWNGERWLIPCEFGSDSVFELYANKGAIHKTAKEGGFAVKIDEPTLQQIRQDLVAALLIPQARRTWNLILKSKFANETKILFQYHVGLLPYCLSAHPNERARAKSSRCDQGRC